jgi:hypothetical protein
VGYLEYNSNQANERNDSKNGATLHTILRSKFKQFALAGVETEFYLETAGK